MNGHLIAEQYNQGLPGWLGYDLAKAEFDLLCSRNLYNFIEFDLVGDIRDSRKFMLYDVCRKVLGQDTENYPQQIGDCVSFGAKNATEYLECCEILMKGDLEKFENVFPPYIYGISRCQIGNDGGSGDGSLGAWAAAGVMKYGMISSKTPNCPAYSGSVAKKWGNSGPPEEFITVGKTHLVKSAAEVNAVDKILVALQNGYPVTVASNQGFAMEAGSDGFHRASGSWAHQMCIIGIDLDYKTPYVIILNNWGDCHGQLKDFDTGDLLPKGVIRARIDQIERSMIRGGEVFAYSNFDGFPEQRLDKALFKLI